MMPIAPVLVTCVPPHADRSKSGTSINRNVPILPDDLIGQVFGRGDELGGRHTGEVYRRELASEMEADRRDVCRADESGRQHVLPRELLHVI